MSVQDLKKTEILLESGTNELEILEFTIADRHFGINVAKVVEIMAVKPVTPMPNANPFVEGVFKPRDSIITVINLAAYLGLPPAEDGRRDILIITTFNKVNTAFHVHNVVSIHRISWQNIEKPDPSIYGGADGLATGIARVDERLVTIIDFEKILADISPQAGIQMSDIDKLGHRERSMKPILVVEDSPMLECMILDSLKQSGYVNVACSANGKEAWDKLMEIKKSGQPIAEQVACVITDIEMPQMDGHHLIKLIRNDTALSALPIIIFSSLIDEEMYQKGEALGATAQITKPEIGRLVTLIDQCIL